MSWMQQLGGLLQQYAGADVAQAPPQAHQDFSQLAQAIPPNLLAQGIAHAFRSDQTPPFEQMVGQLFGQSDPHQQSGLLNTLLQAADPALVGQALSGGGLSGLAGLLGGGQVGPQQAAQVPPNAVEQLAGLAMQQDPSIVDTVSGFMGQHPGLFQSLGAGAVTAALSGLAQQHQSGGVLPASMDPLGDPADQGYR